MNDNKMGGTRYYKFTLDIRTTGVTTSELPPAELEKQLLDELRQQYGDDNVSISDFEDATEEITQMLTDMHASTPPTIH